MKNFLRNNLTATVIVITTFMLGGVAIFTAYKLYQLKQQPVSPNAPASKPAAEESGPDANCQFTFTLSSSTPTATPTESATPTPSGTSTASPTPTASSTPSSTPTNGPTSTPSQTSTPAPTLPPTNPPVSIPTPTPPSLPQAGTTLPSILGIGLGTLLLLVGVILIL